MNVFPVAVRASWVSRHLAENYLPSGAAPRGYQPLIPASGGSLPTGPRGGQRDAHTRLEIYQSSRETAAIEMGKFRKKKKEPEMLGRLRLRLGRRRHSVWSSLVTLFLLPRRCPPRRRLRLLLLVLFFFPVNPSLLSPTFFFFSCTECLCWPSQSPGPRAPTKRAKYHGAGSRLKSTHRRDRHHHRDLTAEMLSLCVPSTFLTPESRTTYATVTATTSAAVYVDVDVDVDADHPRARTRTISDNDATR